MKKLFSLALLVLGMLAGPAAGAALAQTDYTDTVTTTGTGKVDVEPDLARISIGVNAGAKTAPAAVEKVAAKSTSVFDALRAAGVQDDDITVADVSVFRKTDRRGNFLRYVARVGIKVETKALDQISAFINAAVAGGASAIRNITFDVEDRTAAVQQALGEAMRIARQKAETLADAAGRQVGDVLIISEGHASGPRPAALSFDVAAGGSSGGGAQEIPITPPTLSASGTVTVTYRLI